MKRLLTLLFIISCASLLVANEHVSVTSDIQYEYHNHETFEVWYDVDTKNPAYVIWDLTAEDAIISAQNNHRKSWVFNKCGSAPNATVTYKKSGFDRGHMCPNEDRDLSEDDARNTFRGCNVCPQTHKLNAGRWKIWEEKERSLAQKYGLVTVIAGPVYTDKDVRIKGEHVVPDKFFKIIIINHEPKYILVFHQSNTETFVSLEDIEKLTGLKFEVFQEAMS